MKHFQKITGQVKSPTQLSNMYISSQIPYPVLLKSLT